MMGFLATADPTASHSSPCIYSVIWSCIPSESTPIHINPLVSLQARKRDNRTLKTALENSPTLFVHATSPLRPTPLMPLVLRESYKSPVQMILLALLREYSNMCSGPLRPKISNNPALLSNSSQAQTQDVLFSQTQTKLSQMTLPDEVSNPREDFFLQPHGHSEGNKNSGLLQGTEAVAPSLNQPTQILVDEPSLTPVRCSNSASSNGILLTTNGGTHVMPARTPLRMTTSPTNSNQALLSSLSTHSITAKKKRKMKEKRSPTRRSQRIRARQPTETTQERRSDKASKQVKEIRFDLPIPDTPLDIETTLAILAASGLEVSKQIEEMVQGAANRDQSQTNADSEMPLTPLHDPIPPLAIPGFELPF